MTAAVFALGTVVMLVGLVRMPHGRRVSREWVTFGLDAATVAVAAVMFTWHFSGGFGTGLSVLTRTPAAELGVVGMACLAGLVVLKVGVGGGEAANRPAIRCFAVAAAVATAGAAAGGLIADRPWLNVLQVVLPPAMTLAGEAGRLQRLDPARIHPRPPRRYSYLPYLAVGAADGLLVGVQRRTPSVELVGVGVIVLTGLVVARQLVALRENARLVAQLELSESRSRHQATHDALTGLANRLLFGTRLAQALAEAPARAAVILIDLDDFKAVNDRLGHDVGDGLLVAVAHRLTDCVRSADLVAASAGTSSWYC